MFDECHWHARHPCGVSLFGLFNDFLFILIQAVTNPPEHPRVVAEDSPTKPILVRPSETILGRPLLDFLHRLDVVTRVTIQLDHVSVLPIIWINSSNHKSSGALRVDYDFTLIVTNYAFLLPPRQTVSVANMCVSAHDHVENFAIHPIPHNTVQPLGAPVRKINRVQPLYVNGSLKSQFEALDLRGDPTTF